MDCAGKYRLFAAAFCCFILGLFAVGARAQGIDRKLEALESAYRAGVLSDEEYREKKAALTNRKGNGSKPGQADLLPGKQDGVVFRHPTGISFWRPASWQAQTLSGIMQLLPPGAANSPDAYETYYITAEDVSLSGVTSPDHPAVLEHLEYQMGMLGQEIGVSFHREGGLRPVKTSQGNGIRVDWVAESAYGPVQGRAYVSIVKNYGFVLAGVGVKDLLDRREKDVLRIFSSFGVGEGKFDRLLVGAWQLKSTYAIQNDSVWETDYSRAQMASESTSVLTFDPDGSWAREDKYQMIAGAGSVWLEDSDRSVSGGRWNADGGNLFMLWEDQSFEDCKYRIQGDELRIQAGGKGQVWNRIR